MRRSATGNADGAASDHELVSAAVEGDRAALETLVRRHQGFIYEMAVRMLWDPQEAEDATQEILIKFVTGLRSFRGESAFRTWAYRVAANHLISRRRGRAEALVAGFDGFGRKIDELPNLELEQAFPAEEERRVLEQETRIACLSGMLLCLDRPQRLALILGELFHVTDVVASEVLDISRDNYRQRLARARHQLYAFMSGKCGLADASNPCRCARKTRGAILAGIVDPKSLRFVASHVAAVERSAPERSRVVAKAVEAGYSHLFRDQNRRGAPDLVPWLRTILSDQRLRGALDLDGKRS